MFEKRLNSSVLVILIFASVLISRFAYSSPNPDIWFVKSGAIGDGKSMASPIGTLLALERISGPGDTIFLIPSESALDGGLALKAGQQLIGLAASGRKPVITNSSLARNTGIGIVLANNSSVSNVNVENTFASAIYGFNVSSIRIDGVDVLDANQSKSFIEASYPTLPGLLPHGGMVFVHNESPAEISVSSSSVFDTAGFGIVSLSSQSAGSSLTVSHTQVVNGSPIGMFDAGISSLAQGATTNAYLNIIDSQIWGRLSRQGRNVMIVASGGAKTFARIERSYSGATGQDGIVAAVMQSPSHIGLQIKDSLLEDAGQMNVEGTLVNLNSADPSRATEGLVTIEIERSTIRNAGAITGFEDVAANVWLGGSQFPGDRPPAMGNYKLQITDSKIEDAGRVGLQFGEIDLLTEGSPEKSIYDVVLRRNTIISNGIAEIMIYAPNAKIDARGNCWGQPEGLKENRLVILPPVEITQIQTTEAISCNLKSSQ